MEFFDEFEITGGLIPNLFGLAFFWGDYLFRSNQKSKSYTRRKSSSSPIKMILFAKAQIIGGIVPNLIAFVMFLGAIGYFALTGKMAEMFGWKNKN